MHSNKKFKTEVQGRTVINCYDGLSFSYRHIYDISVMHFFFSSFLFFFYREFQELLNKELYTNGKTAYGFLAVTLHWFFCRCDFAIHKVSERNFHMRRMLRQCKTMKKLWDIDQVLLFCSKATRQIRSLVRLFFRSNRKKSLTWQSKILKRIKVLIRSLHAHEI